MTARRSKALVWSLLALLTGALLAAAIADIGPGGHLGWAVFLPVVFLEILVPADCQWFERRDEPRRELDLALASAACRAPPASSSL